jgi:hypothetical protein
VPLWAKALLPAVRRYHQRRIADALDGADQARVLATSPR